MINVGFFYHFSDSWMGGVNYIRNLLHAVAGLKDKKIVPHVFTAQPEVRDQLGHLAKTIVVPLLPRSFAPKLIQRCERELTGSSRLYRDIIKDYGIDVVSHSGLFGIALPCRTINWIPDFLLFRMPWLFPPLSMMRRNIEYLRILRGSSRIMLSSRAALNDLRQFAPACASRAAVVSFVSQPDHSVFSVSSEVQKKELTERLGITGDYFYLPNQFWTHKNHIVVWRAVRRLRDRGVKVLVICTGSLHDYRNRRHQEALLRYIDEHDLSEHLRVLGLIDYQLVMYLFRNALAVINPSKFEGWSSTVEEAKSLGLHCLLSDIDVHREQDSPGAEFFQPDDDLALSALLARHWENRRQTSSPAADTLRRDLGKRTLEFGSAYQQLVISAMNGKQ